MSAKRVAVFVPSLTGGGAERTNTVLANEFAKRGHLVDLVVVEDSGTFRRMVADNVRLIVLGSRYCMTSGHRFWRYLRRERPDVVLATMRAGIVALLANKALAKSPRTVVRHECSYSGLYETSDALGRLLLRLQSWVMPSADAVVSVSKDAAAELVEVVPKAASKVMTIWNPVYGQQLLELSREPVSHPWLNDPETPVVLSVGRLMPQKDYGTLLDAFALVLQSRRARLVIVGEGPDRPMLAARIKALGIADFVDLPGFADNPFAYMKSAHVFVMSSFAEGLPAVLIEALSCGTPVVSTNCPTGPREILDDGKWGRLVPVGDSEAMAEAIVQTLDDPPDSAVQVGRAKSFDVDASVDQHLEVMLPDLPD